MTTTIAVKPTTNGAEKGILIEDVGGSLMPVTKLYTGADGVDGGPVTSANPLHVAPNVTRGIGVADANTQRVTLASDGPANVSLASIDTKTPALVGGATPVTASSLPLPTGAATQATLANIDAEIALVEGYFKAEDAPAVSGDKGLPALVVRRAADTPTTDADGDYGVLISDAEGRLKVSVKPATFDLVSGNITANAQTVVCDVSRASNVLIMMNTSSLSGHNVTFEGSIDSTNGTDGVFFGIQVVRTNANTIELTTGALAATPAYAWEASVNGLSFIRVRATAHTSGTATWKFQRGSYATEPVPAAQATATQPISGSLTSAGTTTATPATPTASIVNSAATTNGTVVKASAGTLYGIVASNTSASIRYLKLHNSTSVTPGTTAVAMTIILPAAATVQLDFGPMGMRYGTGICLSITSGAADNDTAAIGASEVKVNTAFI